MDLEDFAPYAYTTRKGLEHCYDATLSIAGVPGVLVECGVAMGAQVGVMSAALSEIGQTRDIHLFDSFEGIPMSGPKDMEQPGIGVPRHDVHAPLRERLVSSGVSVGSIDVVKANLARWGRGQRFHFHQGWFQDVLPVELPPIALLRLDADLYESTLCCLTHLYPLMAHGGVVVIDDYALAGCRAAVCEYRQANNINMALRIEDIGGGIIASWYT